MIFKQDDKYVIKSKSGKTLGSFDSEQAAQDRLRVIEYFASREGVKRIKHNGVPYVR